MGLFVMIVGAKRTIAPNKIVADKKRLAQREEMPCITYSQKVYEILNHCLHPVGNDRDSSRLLTIDPSQAYIIITVRSSEVLVYSKTTQLIPPCTAVQISKILALLFYNDVFHYRMGNKWNWLDDFFRSTAGLN